MSLNKEQVENAIYDLESEVYLLRKALELLAQECNCTVKERISGHLVDCPIPHVKELLEGGAK